MQSLMNNFTIINLSSGHKISIFAGNELETAGKDAPPPKWTKDANLKLSEKCLN